MALLCFFEWIEFLIIERRARPLTWKRVLGGLAMAILASWLRSPPPRPGLTRSPRTPRRVRVRPARYRNLTLQQYIDMVVSECGPRRASLAA